MGRVLNPKGGNDRVMTPDDLALRIMVHFRPAGTVLEPCAGEGAFVRAYEALNRYRIVTKIETFELEDGTDFLTDPARRRDWIVTNPPFSKFRKFLKRSMEVSDNVVFLCTTNHMLALRARRNDMKAAGFGIVEVCEIETPPEPWPQSGFQVGAVWIRRGWTGACSFTSL